MDKRKKLVVGAVILFTVTVLMIVVYSVMPHEEGTKAWAMTVLVVGVVTGTIGTLISISLSKLSRKAWVAILMIVFFVSGALDHINLKAEITVRVTTGFMLYDTTVLMLFICSMLSTVLLLVGMELSER